MSDPILFKELQECKRCRFHDWEVNTWDPTTGYGKYGAFSYSDKANVMVIGQNPSNARFPAPLNHSMSGHQGDLFREIFGKEKLIFSNIIQISTPDNKVLDIDAMHGVWHLRKEIEFYNPKIIIALGKWNRKYIPPLHNVVYLPHPDYYLSYRKSEIPQYREAILRVKESYDQL